MKHFILKLMCLSLLFYLSLAYAGNKEAATNDGKGSIENPYVIPRTTSEINIDGKLEEAAWQEALVIDLPYETWPGENIEAPVRTEAMLLYTKVPSFCWISRL
jgi:hypothetical protein